MRKDLFRKGLEEKGVGAKGVTNRVVWCTKIEEDFNVDLDLVCKSQSKYKKLIEEIEVNAVYKKGEKKNLIVSLQRYFEFYNTVQP